MTRWRRYRPDQSPTSIPSAFRAGNRESAPAGAARPARWSAPARPLVGVVDTGDGAGAAASIAALLNSWALAV